jgi:hypothetical protein
MITKKYGVDFESNCNGSPALTLYPDDIRNSPHIDGWTITGNIHEDYYEWVNEFQATHPIYGKVWGNFEDEVFADSEDGFKHFYENHPPEAWDYYDI